MRLRNRVRERRVERGMFKSECARRAGMSRQTLSAIEADDGHQPLSSHMTALAEVLGDPGLFWWEAIEDQSSAAIPGGPHPVAASA
jgi:DNA-binding XRE family transcriptional regulator